MDDSIFVDVIFPLAGDPLPLDHGYLIYSALSRKCSAIHEIPNLSIHPISGTPDSEKKLHLLPNSSLKIRIPHFKIPLIYNNLVTEKFKIGINNYFLDIPTVKTLTPAPSLYSRLVIIRRHQNPESFQVVANQQLTKLGIEGDIKLLSRKDGNPQCRQLTIKNQRGSFKVRGFAVKVDNLSKDDSLTLQAYGLGGKQKMMCGVFVPSTKEKTS
jgi:CRISPR-associated endonuclease/helicase Cas3